MFRSVLIANRGEIALRIQRACRTLGLRTVEVYSEADRHAAHVRQADVAVCIGPAAAARSYLDAAAILLAAEATGAEAIHPGYGFLSEDPDFAELVAQAGLTFIGPGAACIRTMGDKVAAKRAMRRAGVPCVPGPDGALPDDPDAVRRVAAEIGYSVILKAAGGGGGRGMRTVSAEDGLLDAFALTREEARRAFGNPAIYVEKFLGRLRHVEIQVIADWHGNALWLGSRDRSLQRRRQKVLEEAPAPGLPEALVAEVGARCAEACRRIVYRGVGTFEFLVEYGAFFFIEMNTRVQVEHPVTEMTAGIDIVAEGIRVAQGERLGLSQDGVTCRGGVTGRPAPGGRSVRILSANALALRLRPKAATPSCMACWNRGLSSSPWMTDRRIAPAPTAGAPTAGTSAGSRSHASAFFIPRILQGRISAGYAMAKAYKDLVSGAGVSAGLGIPTHVLAAATATYQAALLRGDGEKDKGGMVHVFEELLGARYRSRADQP